MSLDSATRNLAQAQANLATATERVDAADLAVDDELAKRGWHRFNAVVGPTVKLYENALHPGSTIERSALVRELERQAAA
jgi:hypothetical protein